MKNSILIFGSTIILFLTILTGCQPSDKKEKITEDKVQETKKDIADSEKDLYIIKLDTISNYEQFKIEAEKIIDVQEKNIDEFKVMFAGDKNKINDDYNKKLDELKNINKELKMKLADYKDNGLDKWNGFKNEFNHDINQLGKAFKDLTVENAK